MKKIVCMILGLFLLIQVVSAQTNSKTTNFPDILVDTKLDYDWTGLVINKVRNYLKNIGVGDPFNSTFDEPIVVTESLVESYLDADATELLNDLGSVIGLNLLQGETKIVIHGLSYDIKDFKTELKAAEEHKDGMSLSTNFTASHVGLTAEKITLSLIIPGKNGTSSPVLEIDIIRPKIKAQEEDLIKFFVKFKLQDKKDHFRMLIEQSNFDSIAQTMFNRPDAIDLNIEKIIIPEVSIRVGNRKLDFSAEKIEKLLTSKLSGIKSLLLSQFATLLTEGMGESALKIMETYRFEKAFWMDAAPLMSKFEISKFSSRLIDNHLEIMLNADFCTTESYNASNERCVNQKVTPNPISRMDWNMHARSIRFMKDLIKREDASIVASISEDYINKLLMATYDGGLWTDVLKDAGIMLGPKKIFIRMDEVGETATLFMDVVYTPRKIERLALGAKEVRFPMIVKASVRIEIDRDTNVPTVILKSHDLDLTDSTLLRGRPELGLESNIHTLRLKKKVLSAIRTEMAAMKNKDLIDLKYPEFKGMGLEEVDFISDGKGRLHAFLRLRDLTEAN